MSWVCPMCSTNNEEFESKCIVCEYERVSDWNCQEMCSRKIP